MYEHDQSRAETIAVLTALGLQPAPEKPLSKSAVRPRKPSSCPSNPPVPTNGLCCAGLLSLVGSPCSQGRRRGPGQRPVQPDLGHDHSSTAGQVCQVRREQRILKPTPGSLPRSRPLVFLALALVLALAPVLALALALALTHVLALALALTHVLALMWTLWIPRRRQGGRTARGAGGARADDACRD